MALMAAKYELLSFLLRKSKATLETKLALHPDIIVLRSF
jgi:hypothetical protein